MAGVRRADPLADQAIMFRTEAVADLQAAAVVDPRADQAMKFRTAAVVDPPVEVAGFCNG